MVSLRVNVWRVNNDFVVYVYSNRLLAISGHYVMSPGYNTIPVSIRSDWLVISDHFTPENLCGKMIITLSYVVSVYSESLLGDLCSLCDGNWQLVTDSSFFFRESEIT